MTILIESIRIKHDENTLSIRYKEDKVRQHVDIPIKTLLMPGASVSLGGLIVEYEWDKKTFVKEGNFGLKPSSITELNLASYLPIKPTDRCWFYLRGVIVFIKSLTVQQVSYGVYNESELPLGAMNIDTALHRWLVKFDQRYTPTRHQIITRLKHAGLKCTDSPLSCTAIRVFYDGEVQDKVASLVKNPYFSDWRISPNGRQQIDLWEWGPEVVKA